jgi:hypothetical protein
MKFAKIVSTAALICGATQANATLLECNIKPTENTNGFVTELYYFEYEPGAKEATVADALIQYFNDGPITAKLAEDTKKKTVFSWSVLVTGNAGAQTKMQYRAAYFKADKSITITATPGGGYGGSFEARGKCK